VGSRACAGRARRACPDLAVAVVHHEVVAVAVLARPRAAGVASAGAW
jgi:hypothetical protein